MHTLTLDTTEASNKRWAAWDARQRNINNASHFSSRDKIRAERMKLALELVYGAKNFYIAYGKQGKISIKVDAAHVKDKKNLLLLEQEWAGQGVIKKVSPQGVIYNFAS